MCAVVSDAARCMTQVNGTTAKRLTQDGVDPAVKRAAVHYATATGGGVRLLLHGRNASAPLMPDERCSNDAGRPGHVLFALRTMLDCLHYPSLLVLRAGAALAPDALGLFAAAQWLPGSDATLWCVSGGPAAGTEPPSAADPRLLLRSDVAPDAEGGWMLGRAVGVELLQAWRRGGYSASLDGDDGGADGNKRVDDSAAGWRRWLSRSTVRRGRQCVVPELPRIATPVDGGSGGDAAFPAPPTPFALAARNGSRPKGARPFAGIDWSHADISHLLEPAFQNLMLQVCCSEIGCGLRATDSRALALLTDAIDVLAGAPKPAIALCCFRLQKLRNTLQANGTAASGVPAGRKARRVRYGTLAEYRTAVIALGSPFAVDMSPDRYCFTPPGVAKQHCQVRRDRGCLWFASALHSCRAATASSQMLARRQAVL